MGTGSSRFHIRPVDLPVFAVYGVIGLALNYLGFIYAIEFTSVATAITLVYTYPAFVVVFAFILFREPITRWKAVALGLTFIGIILSALASSSLSLGGDSRGPVLALLTGVSVAVYTLSGKSVQARYQTQTALFYSFLFGSLALGAFRAAQLGLTYAIGAEAFLWIVVIAIVPTLLGYGMHTYSLRFIEAGNASIISNLEPVMAIILAYLFLGQTPASIQLLGTALIVSGVMVLQIRRTQGT
jgi:DME family drug/metabolite transporter